MNLEDYTKLVHECERKIERKRGVIKVFLFFVLFTVLFLIATFNNWANSWFGNLMYALLFSVYPGFILWSPWDFDTILRYSKSYRELNLKINNYKKEGAEIEEAARVAKYKGGIEKLKVLKAIYDEIFNRRISVEYLGKYKDFIHIENDLWVNNYHFDYGTRSEFELLHKYSKQLQDRINNFNLDKGSGVRKVIGGTESSGILKEPDNEINDDNIDQKVKLASIESFRNKYKQYKIRDGKNDWRSGKRIKIDYLKKNSQNIYLGLQGESIVLKWERDNLIEGGMEDLAEKVRHISQEIGDGAGFDILSYDEDGNEKFIEVKTTKSGLDTQFYFSDGELNFIKNTQNYYLYRLSLENENEAELTIISKDEFLNRFEVIPYQYTVKFKTG